MANNFVITPLFYLHAKMSTLPLRLSGEQRKRERDRTRKRGGGTQKKRAHVLMNPEKLAFRGWEEEQEPWSMAAANRHLEWCHINKLFPPERHRVNRYACRANLTFALDREFAERCIQVYQWLYNEKYVKANCAALFICRMVYAEVKLHKVVDWSTTQVKDWTEADIPQYRKYSEGGLGRAIKNQETPTVVRQLEVPTSASSTDSNSDGCRGPKARRKARPSAEGSTSATRAPVARRRRATAAIPTMEQANANVPLPENVESQHIPLEVDMEHDGDDEAGEEVEVLTNAPVDLGAALAEKDRIIADLENTIRALKVEATASAAVITDLRAKLGEGPRETPVGMNDPVQHIDPMDVDEYLLNNVVNQATAGVLEGTPQRRHRPTVILPPMGPVARPYIDMDGPLSQDSLSFPTNAENAEVSALKTENDELRLRLAKMSEQYYQWKVACIFSVVQKDQLAMEIQKIGHDYTLHNTRRDFGLTSWAHTDELYPTDIPTMRKGSNTRIDWAKLDFDYEHAMSCHDLRMDPMNPSRKLWQNPAPFVVDGIECGICQNEFGPEGAWALGSCAHMFHPVCLLSVAVLRRFCPICRAPFHKRLYDVFGLTSYMPPSHEHNPENTPGDGYRNKWGDDLLWSWRATTHSLFKSNVSAQFGWEEDHQQIVEVCNKIVGQGAQLQGKRNFFFQTLNGFWDAGNQRFQFGVHPEGKLWNAEGKLVTNANGIADVSIRNAVQMDLSQWKTVYQSEAVDYLLERHSPETLRMLEGLRSSQMIRQLAEADGPHNYTRARARLNFNPSGLATVSNSADVAGPSNSADVFDLNED